MFCVIYRSARREQLYLYIPRMDDFSSVPSELLHYFGQPQRVMLLPLDGSKSLVNADLAEVKRALTNQGYYLQLPPPAEDLLRQHQELWHGGKK